MDDKYYYFLWEGFLMGKTFFLLLILVLGIFILQGCSATQNDSDVAVVTPEKMSFDSYNLVRWKDSKTKDGNYTFLSNPATISSSGYLEIVFNLKEWSEKFYPEVLFMNEESFQNFRNDEDYYAWHYTITNSGTTVIRFTDITPEQYHVIVDNSDMGWELSDDDEINDYIVYDITADFYPGEENK